MSALASPGVAEETDVVVALDFTPTLPCEGLTHSRGINGHEPGAPGAYFLVCPGCGPRVVQCAPRVAMLHEIGLLTCRRCGVERLVEAYTFTPITDNK